METAFVGVLSLLVGALLKTAFDRSHAVWLKRRDTAAEAYSAAVAVHSAVVSSLTFARRVEAKTRAQPHEVREIADSSSWNISSHLQATRSRLDKLREARLNTRSIWGPGVAALFDDYFELTSAWHNVLAAYHDELVGVSPDRSSWDADATGFDWNSVLAGSPPHGESFDHEEEYLMERIRRFARSAGVAIIDLVGLPSGVRKVVTEYEDHKKRRQLVATGRAALPPPK